MPSYATSVQNENHVWFGSGRFEISDDGMSSWANLGAAKSITVEEQITIGKVEADNAPDFGKKATKHVAAIKVTGYELNPITIDKLRGGGLDIVENIAGTLVEGAEQVIASGNWAYNEFIEFTNQMGDGTCPTINSVTLGTNGAIVEETDYVTVKDGNGEWGIIIWDSTTVTTEDQTVTIDTDYTPSAGVTISTGGLTEIGNVAIKITNVQYVGGVEKTKSILLYKCDISKGLSLALKSSNEADQAMEVPLEFEAYLDTTRTPGDQLYKIYDGNA